MLVNCLLLFLCPVRIVRTLKWGGKADFVYKSALNNKVGKKTLTIFSPCNAFTKKIGTKLLFYKLNLYTNLVLYER